MDKRDSNTKTNPYAQPASVLDGEVALTVPRRLGLMFWLIAAASAFFSLILACIGSFVVPAFLDVFNGFGADVPWATAFLLSTRDFWWAAPAMAIGLWVYSLRSPARLQHRSRLMLAFAALGAGSMALAAIVMVSVYAPIFQLGVAGK